MNYWITTPRIVWLLSLMRYAPSLMIRTAFLTIWRADRTINLNRSRWKSFKSSLLIYKLRKNVRWKSTGLWSTWEDKFSFLLPYYVTCVRSAVTKAVHLMCLLSQRRIFGEPADNFQLHILCAKPYLRFKKREKEEVPRKEPIHYISQKWSCGLKCEILWDENRGDT